MFSDEAKYEEIMGLTHWMIFTDGKSLFAKNYIRDSKVFTLLKDQEEITSLAVDANKGYIFFSIQSDSDSSYVNRYSIEIDASDPKNPLISLNETSMLEVMQGQEIVSIAVDHDQSILYVADSGEEKIKNLKYAPEMLTIINSEIGLEDVMYSQLHNMNHISSVTIDLYGDIYWSFDKYGKEQGVVAKASADSPGVDTIEV